MLGARSGINIFAFVAKVIEVSIHMLAHKRVFRTAAVAKSVFVFICMLGTGLVFKARAK